MILRNLTGAAWPSALLSAGAVISIFSATLVVIYGQTRILFAMSRDGMLREVFHRVNPRTLTPVRNTIVVAIFIAVLAAFVPLNVLANLTSMGTLVAFAIVSIGVMILRRTQPDLPRGFRVPFFPLVPLLSVAFCVYLISGLPGDTFLLFAVWLAVALVIYFTYSVHHSKLAQPAIPGAEPPWWCATGRCIHRPSATTRRTWSPSSGARRRPRSSASCWRPCPRTWQSRPR